MLRNTQTLFAVLLMFGVVSSNADQFRFKERKGKDDTLDVSYASVKALRSGTVLFQGKTDKYGRIVINLPNGRYITEVTVGKEKKIVEVQIDGKQNSKIAFVR
jgi:hypothetical protein